jgi:hypothetical protein
MEQATEMTTNKTTNLFPGSPIQTYRGDNITESIRIPLNSLSMSSEILSAVVPSDYFSRTRSKREGNKGREFRMLERKSCSQSKALYIQLQEMKETLRSMWHFVFKQRNPRAGELQC